MWGLEVRAFKRERFWVEMLGFPGWWVLAWVQILGVETRPPPRLRSGSAPPRDPRNVDAGGVLKFDGFGVGIRVYGLRPANLLKQERER